MWLLELEFSTFLIFSLTIAFKSNGCMLFTHLNSYKSRKSSPFDSMYHSRQAYHLLQSVFKPQKSSQQICLRFLFISPYFLKQKLISPVLLLHLNFLAYIIL